MPQAMGEALSGLGVQHAFGLVGSGNFHLVNAMVESGTRFVAARQETGAMTMADAYARASRRLGVCSVHQGPGFTNAITGLAEAAKSRTPVLLIAAEAMPRPGMIDCGSVATAMAEAAAPLASRLTSAMSDCTWSMRSSV